MAIWYSAGIRFECTACGSCCGGSPGMVWISLPEIAAISAFLGTTTSEFGRQYLRLVDDRLSLIEKKNFDCIFLEKGKCAIYPVRPRQCRLFPFWDSILEDREVFEDHTKTCPGVGRGRLYSAEEIENIRKSR